MECSSWSMTLIYSISWAIMSWFCTVLLSISALQVEFFLVIWPLISLRLPGLPRNSISTLLLLFSHSVMSDSATPWTEAHQTALPFTISQSLFKFMSIESMMPSNHLFLCCPLLLLPSIFPSIKVFSIESALHIRQPKYWSFNCYIDQMFVSHLDSYVEVLTLNVAVFRAGALRRWWGFTLMNGIV